MKDNESENIYMTCPPPTRKLVYYLSRRMGKPTICIGENKGADQLRSNCEADHRLCFRYRDSTVPLLSKSKISSLLSSSVTVQPGLCQTWSEPKMSVFSRTGSNFYSILGMYICNYDQQLVQSGPKSQHKDHVRNNPNYNKVPIQTSNIR